MTYRITWENAALAELDEIWRESSDKEGIENVAIRINTELTHRPGEAGKSRDDNERVLFKHPLVIWFRVLERLSEVQVLHVRMAKR